MNPVIELLKAHRSIRKFTDQPVPDETVRAIIEAAQCASTSSFVQAYTVIRVRSPETRRQIAELAGGQEHVVQCPVFLVFCADLHRIRNACKQNGVEMPEGYMETFIVATVDAALAAQNVMIAAESLGMGGVYVGGIRNDPYKMCDLLQIPDQAYPVFGMCLGHSAQDPECKPRLPVDVVLKEEVYGTGGDAALLGPHDEKISDYYRRRTKGKRADTWTGQVAELMGNKQRPHMRDFLGTKGFGMR